jgi:hypothetical protein
MKLTATLVIACFLIAIRPVSNSGVPKLVTPDPSIEIQCSLHDIHDDPPELEATVKFEWQASNANYVLINGHDRQRHSVTGAFDQARGGAYTFIAVAGARKLRKPRMCFQSFRQGTVIHHLIWSVRDDLIPHHFAGPDEFFFTTSIARERIIDRISELLRSEYSVVPASQTAANFDVFIYTRDYGTGPGLCDVDGCKKDGQQLERQIGFNILLEHTVSESGAVTYGVRVIPEVLVREAKSSKDWEIDPESEKVASPIVARLTERIRALVD